MKSREYEWDPVKARANLRKHDVSFASAALSLLDERALVRTDPDSNGEARYVAIGVDPLGHALVTVFTFRGERVRIISSRRATRSERRTYEQG
ncbi:MAG TPA: BrnT family toxin [Steroidobacteraceae bacterium]|nr:BrnT family toxin [Steroidobacteraceae bacterium]